MDRIKQVGTSLLPTSAPDRGFSEEELKTGLRKRKTESNEDLPRALNEWRKKSTINPQKLGVILFGPMYDVAQQWFEFNRKELILHYGDHFLRSKEEQRVIANELFIKINKRFPISREIYETNPWMLVTLIGCTGGLYPSTGTKLAIHFGLYSKSIQTLGTDKHLKKLDQALRLQDLGCFALTEVSHGTNVQGMLTTAVYDEVDQLFYINTPIERAAKFWIGGASQTANMAVVGANLIVKGKNYGIHMFLVNIRNSVTHDLMPGISILDCGDKMGLNGIDNGMIFFRNVAVPLDNLLDKVTKVSPTGEVTSLFNNKGKRFAVQLSGLCDGRVKLLNTCTLGIVKSTTIALRYAAIRRQFGPNNNSEFSIINYEQYQARVFPHAAAGQLLFFSARRTNQLWIDNYRNVLDPHDTACKEMHAVISIMKPLITWASVDALNQMRQALGGYGYLSISNIPCMLNDSHVQLTWEGDNYILIHQTARFVLKGLFNLLSDKPIKYKTLQYLTMVEFWDYLGVKELSTEHLSSPEMLEKLMCYRANLAARAAATTFQKNLTSTESFKAWNASVPYGHSDAAIYYGEMLIFQYAYEEIKKLTDQPIQQYLNRLLTIFALTKLKESWSHLGTYLSREVYEEMNATLLKTFDEVKYDIVRSSDGLLGDEYINSPFGTEDGDVYGRLLSKLNGERTNFGKPPGWRNLWENRQAY
jgi:acyl-CoA oxidase